MLHSPWHYYTPARANLKPRAQSQWQDLNVLRLPQPEAGPWPAQPLA